MSKHDTYDPLANWSTLTVFLTSPDVGIENLTELISTEENGKQRRSFLRRLKRRRGMLRNKADQAEYL